MLYIILLLILAVLLFGSSAVLGAIGIMLGGIIALIAIVWACISLGISGEMLLVGLAALAAMIGIANYFLNELPKKSKPIPPAKTAVKPVSEEYRRAYESMQFRARAKRDQK